jgi:HD-like signal output (HDOD) protein
MDADSRVILEKLRAGYFLPSLSAIAMRLVELASSEDTSLDQLAALIEKDPSLTVRLLKLANSTLLRAAEPVTSIEQAIFRIGFNRLRIMALSLSLRDTFPMGRRGPMDYEAFWRASVYRATLAKSLAQRFGGVSADEAFVAGLIQEIGLLILFDLFVKGKDEAFELGIYPLRDLLTRERDRYGLDHRQVGEAALTYWNFPDRIIACQRAVVAVVDPRATAPLCATCETARELARIICHRPADLSSSFDMVRVRFGLDHETISEMLLDAFDQVESLAESLNLELNRDRDLLDIMEKANAALARISERIPPAEYPPDVKLPSSFHGLTSAKNPAVDETLQAVAHEIRNPLVSVGGFVKRLSKTIDPSSKTWDYVQIILDETRKLEEALAYMTKGGR